MTNEVKRFVCYAYDCDVYMLGRKKAGDQPELLTVLRQLARAVGGVQAVAE